MSQSDNRPVDKPADDFTRTWRYKVGLFLIIGGHLILVAGLLAPMVGAGAGIVGAMVVGGEIIGLTSIVFLGKEGFLAIKSKVFAFLKSGYTGPVSRTRHRIGIVLLLANVLTTYLMMLYAWDAFAAATAEDPTAAVWGLDVAQQGSLVFWMFLAGEVSFLIAIYVLGADWWGKFRNIFVWQESEN